MEKASTALLADDRRDVVSSPPTDLEEVDAQPDCSSQDDFHAPLSRDDSNISLDVEGQELGGDNLDCQELPESSLEMLHMESQEHLKGSKDQCVPQQQGMGDTGRGLRASARGSLQSILSDPFPPFQIP